MAHASKDDPPIGLFYGGDKNAKVGDSPKDPTHSPILGIKLAEKLKSVGVDVVLVYPGRPNPDAGPDFVDATGTPNGVTPTEFFQCPSDETPLEVTQWPGVQGVSVPQITSSTWLLRGSYVYCGNGRGPLSKLNTAPDKAATTLAIECDGEPHQDTDFVRREHLRGKA